MQTKRTSYFTCKSDTTLSVWKQKKLQNTDIQLKHYSRSQIKYILWKAIYNSYRANLGHAVAQSVETLRYKPKGCGFDS